MGISFQDSNTYPLAANDVFNYSISAIKTIGNVSVDYQDMNLGIIVASKGMSLLTWGHRIEIQIMPNGSMSCTISVSSKVKGQIIDYGTSKKIVQEFFGALNFIIERAARSK